MKQILAPLTATLISYNHLTHTYPNERFKQEVTVSTVQFPFDHKPFILSGFMWSAHSHHVTGALHPYGRGKLKIYGRLTLEFQLPHHSW